MHRFILGAPPGQHIYHRNRDTLDNRRENLLVSAAGAVRSLRRADPRAVVREGRASWFRVGPFLRLLSPEHVRALDEQLRGAARAAAVPEPASGFDLGGRNGRSQRRLRLASAPAARRAAGG